MEVVGARLRATAADARLRLDPGRADPRRLAATVAILGLAAFALLWRLGRADWRTDEQADGVAAWQAVQGDWAVVNGHPPLVRLFLGAGQVALGRTALGVRIGPALVGLALVALLLAMGRRLGGFRVGALAAGTWAVVARPVEAAGRVQFAVRLDRYAYLEPWTSFALVAATWSGWAWARRGGWRLAVGTGALVGLGAAFKPTVGLVVPVLVLSALVVRRGDRAVVGEALALAGAAVVVPVATFLPAGRAGPRMLWDTVDFQLDHVRQGHPQVVGGSRTLEQPWWTNLWHQWHGIGPAVTVVLVAAGLVALTGRHRALALHLHGVLLVLVAGHLASPVALPHYHVLWLPLMVLLGALGLDALRARRLRPPGPRRASGWRCCSSPAPWAWARSPPYPRATCSGPPRPWPTTGWRSPGSCTPASPSRPPSRTPSSSRSGPSRRPGRPT